MPKYSNAAFVVQPETDPSGNTEYTLKGVVNRDQLLEIGRKFYLESKRWRGQWGELAKAIVGAIDDTLGADSVAAYVKDAEEKYQRWQAKQSSDVTSAAGALVESAPIGMTESGDIPEP